MHCLDGVLVEPEALNPQISKGFWSFGNTCPSNRCLFVKEELFAYEHA